MTGGLQSGPRDGSVNAIRVPAPEWYRSSEYAAAQKLQAGTANVHLIILIGDEP
jgi:hypothetical protein